MSERASAKAQGEDKRRDLRLGPGHSRERVGRWEEKPLREKENKEGCP